MLKECAAKFATPDYIMEPGIFSQLKRYAIEVQYIYEIMIIVFCIRYFQSGGNPVQVIEQLSDNYTAVAQMANLIAEWLIIGGTFLSVLFIFYLYTVKIY